MSKKKARRDRKEKEVFTEDANWIIKAFDLGELETGVATNQLKHTCSAGLRSNLFACLRKAR
jgi:hypothetical protein